MRIRNIDKNGDWAFGQSQSNYVRNAFAIALDIKMKLREWSEDCFFALQNGIDWSTRLGAHNQKELLDEDILNVVQNVEGVLNILNFQSSISGRKYICTFDVYQQYSIEFLPISFDSSQGVV